MDDHAPSYLKTIRHSKRANLYYLQHCRVLVKGGRVHYVTNEGRESRYWNIANATSILLGTGTSITQAAMRELAKAGVCSPRRVPEQGRTPRGKSPCWRLP